MSHALLLAGADTRSRDLLAAQLDADGHTVHTADTARGALAKLAAQAIDVVLLAELDKPADAPELVREIRARRHPRVHPCQPIITLGAADELTALRAYEAGSDHHVQAGTTYVVLRAIVAAVVRLTLTDASSRHLYVGDLHIDTAGYVADIDGVALRLTQTEFALLAALATDPTRVFTKAELKRAVGRPPRCAESQDNLRTGGSPSRSAAELVGWRSSRSSSCAGAPLPSSRQTG
jgi:DNA-binding response OmpR family regulator